jgi:pimeloyl-ACP methyl ester carboxylesterase
MGSPPPNQNLPGTWVSAGGAVVVLIHGLGANGFLLMWLLARRLKRAGYGTLTWSYPSFTQTIESHGERLQRSLAELDADPAVTRIHLVSHSMGGIVARYAMNLGRPTKLGRFVMVAPPNKGSSLAAFFGPVLRRCFPAIEQLAARPDSFVNKLPEPQGVEIGIIDASIDFLVGAGNTSLTCQRDHIVLRGSHTLLVFQRRLAGEVIQFLATGRFSAVALRRS